jgi:hypothetical protein
MPVLGVCGDSYFAATQDLENRIDCSGSGGKHFSELMAKRLNYDYYTMARGACSNTAIRLQIDEMINQKVDFVLVGTTFPSRIEYIIRKKEFEYTKGIYNIDYSYHPDISSLNTNFQENLGTASETIGNVLAGAAPVLNDDQLETFRRYLIDLYHEPIKKLQDAWIIANGISELQNAKIPFLILIQGYLYDTLVSKFRTNNPRILVHVKPNDKLFPWSYSTYDEDTKTDTVRRYHVSDKNQVAICDQLCNYIQTHNLLVWSDNE